GRFRLFLVERDSRSKALGRGGQARDQRERNTGHRCNTGDTRHGLSPVSHITSRADETIVIARQQASLGLYGPRMADRQGRRNWGRSRYLTLPASNPTKSAEETIIVHNRPARSRHLLRPGRTRGRIKRWPTFISVMPCGHRLGASAGRWPRCE